MDAVSKLSQTEKRHFEFSESYQTKLFWQPFQKNLANVSSFDKISITRIKIEKETTAMTKSACLFLGQLNGLLVTTWMGMASDTTAMTKSACLFLGN